MDVYRMNPPTDYDSDSSNDELIHQLPDSNNDGGDMMDLLDSEEDATSQPQQAIASESRHPPAIATSWNDSVDTSAGDDDRDTNDAWPFSSAAVPPYPVQSINESHKTPCPAPAKLSSSNTDTPSTEETPAFIRQYARDVMKLADHNLASSPTHHAVIPPNSLMGVRETEPRDAHYRSDADRNHQCATNHSFVGADASGLDSTFVSIRDLDEDDDVPSLDNHQSNAKFDGTFPTERTSLLNDTMAWRGGLFLSKQVEREDRKARRRMAREEKGRVTGWVWTVGSILAELWEDGTSTVGDDNGGHRMTWDGSHPTGEEMPVRSYQRSNPRHRTVFSTILPRLLWFHMLLCALHDLFLRYVSHRNDDGTGVSWDGEGPYVPPHWLSFEGRILNPWIGPGSRTLTAFGAAVPGLVLSRGQWWRVPLALAESSSVTELLLHCVVVNTAIGCVRGLECKRGTFAVTLSYVITATIGSVWSMATDKGRLVTSSGMGVSGLLAAFVTERYWFPPMNKREDDERLSHSMSHNDLGGGHNVVSTSADEQFTFQPMPPKKERHVPIKGISPIILLAMEIVVSWWSPYQSLGGTMAAAGMGLALALIMFVGISPEHSLDDNRDLIFNETPPPPPSSAAPWRDDDDSADSSFGSGRQPFTTPIMRKSILGEVDEDEPYGPKSYLRKRKPNGSEAKGSTPARYISMHPNKQYHSTLPILWRIVGIFIAMLLTLLPAVLLVVAPDPSYETIRASILGCKPMVIVYRRNDDDNNVFQCAGGCVPLSRTKMAQKEEMMKNGRCNTIGYRCLDDAGTMILGKYELDVGLYSVPLSDGSCASADDAADRQQEVANDEANNQAEA